MNKILMTTAALLLTTALAQGATTAPVITGRPATLVSVLKGAGYTATLNTVDGSPYIEVKRSNLMFTLYFDGCKQDLCKNITASAEFDPYDGEDADAMDFLNSWNSDFHTQAYMGEEGELYLDSLYTLDGSFTKANFLAWMKNYTEEAVMFNKELQ